MLAPIQNAGGGAECLRVNPANNQLRSFTQRVLCLTVLKTCSSFVCQSHAQSGPQEIGVWSHLFNAEQGVVVWRSDFYPLSDQPVGDYAPNNSWDSQYGIHAALLPNSSLAGDDKRGWVLLWGKGRERTHPYNTYPRILSQVAENLYPQGKYLAKVAVTPVLLWNPKNTNPYGYVRYLFDTDQWNESGQWPIYNLFCSGHAFLPDGNLFMAGGHGRLWNHEYPSQNQNDVGYVGLKMAAIFRSGNFHPTYVASSHHLWYANHPMSEPRWYPMVVALPDGRLLIVGGTQWGLWGGNPERTERYEVYEPCEGTFIDVELPEDENIKAALGTNYPRLHLVSYINNQSVMTARIVYTGPFKNTYWLSAFNPLGSEWGSYDPSRSVNRRAGTSVLLPNSYNNPSSFNQQSLNQVIVLGGYSGQGVSLTTEILTFNVNNTLTIATGPAMNQPRAHVNAVLLPTDEILAFGGIKKHDGWQYPHDVVFEVEMYTKNTQGSYYWKPVAPNLETDADGNGIADGTRVYHSSGLLLPDGTVLTMGSATSDESVPAVTVVNLVPTIYKPPYLFIGENERSSTQRPQILSVSDPLPETPDVDMNYGQNFTLTYQLHEGSGGIRSVVLVRPGSVTHSFNSEQRLVKLPYVVNSSSQLQVTAPYHQSIAPPGWYMLFLVSNDGVPSEAQWVRLKYADCYAPEGGMLNFTFEDLAPSISEEQMEAWEMSPIAVELRDFDSGEVAASYTLSLSAPNEQGQLTWKVPADHMSGIYELFIAPHRSWLGQTQVIDWYTSRSAQVSLRNGDVNHDNVVDALDLAIALEQMGASDSASDQPLSGDVNADGVVDSHDIDIILYNMGETGDR